jgi:hypothetical protein
MQKTSVCLASLLLASAPLLAQAPVNQPFAAAPPGAPLGATEAVWTPSAVSWETASRPLAGNRNFPNFIGFMSNPTQNIDPRALTQLWPVFGANWVEAHSVLPRADMQIYGAGLNVALSERLSVGMVQGGYGYLNLGQVDRRDLLNGLRGADLLSTAQRDQLLQRVDDSPLLEQIRAVGGLQQPERAAILERLDRAGLLRLGNGQRDGDRQGWQDLGGFVQYTLLQDVENQTILTGGVRWIAPSGSEDLFQGGGPLRLSPYLTFGQEFGLWHVLATTGYQFPVGEGGNNRFFYANFHLDRQCLGWIYPLVELNWIYQQGNVDVSLPTRNGFVTVGNFETSGNLLTLAVGVNFVLIRDQLEFGGCYSTPIASQRGFDFNGFLVKMVYRF